MKKILIAVIILLILIGIGLLWNFTKEKPPLVVVTNFEECVKVSGRVAESYPRQCSYGGQTFRENIGNQIEKEDLIRVEFPAPNQKVSSPLTIIGEARGNWFFEASFPVVLKDLNGKEIAQGIANAIGDWMTEDFVPFEAKLDFVVDKNINKGILILKKDNPSGIPERDDSLEIPVVIEENKIIYLPD